MATNEVPTERAAELTLVLTLANPVIDVLPAASVVIPDAAPVKVVVLALIVTKLLESVAPILTLVVEPAAPPVPRLIVLVLPEVVAAAAI